MRATINYGSRLLEVEVSEGALAPVQRAAPAPPLADPAAAIAAALEEPMGFPALRRALTPDDHVAVVVDEELPQLPRLLPPILEHVAQAGVVPGAVTLLCAPSSEPRDWVDELPDEFDDVQVEVHDPADRKRLAYLATTRQGRRVYLNRTAVDADQLIVLTRRGYDPLLGYSGAAGALYPALSDEATRQEAWERLSMAAPDDGPWPLSREAAEVTWLLGVPFLVQVIQGSGPEVAHVLGGPVESSAEGQRLLNERWRVEVAELVDTVVVGVGGDEAGHRFSDLARALACASRVVKRGGRIALLSGGPPALGEGAQLLRDAPDPDRALERLKQRSAGTAAAFQWASAARHARIYLLSGLSEDAVEELFAVPLDDASQVQRLVREGSCLFLSDAEKTLALARES
ncbi:MAG: lactate racemase domain-containing protein [Gemmataceae bacterium]|nr:lactate racemase domain-containing protein [Gemmataceae bacterium]